MGGAVTHGSGMRSQKCKRREASTGVRRKPCAFWLPSARVGATRGCHHVGLGAHKVCSHCKPLLTPSPSNWYFSAGFGCSAFDGLMKLYPSHPPERRSRIVVSGLGLLLILLGLVGCGSTVYMVEVRRAEKHFEEARELGAEEHAPYEYYSAQVRIDQAKRQAAIAEYGPAAKLSDRANDFALQAIQKTKRSRSLARRPLAQTPPAQSPRAERADEPSAGAASTGAPARSDAASSPAEGEQP